VAIIGFCTYGPHILMVGHAAQDFGKKSGAAGAAGFIDGMGYIGASLAGWGVPRKTVEVASGQKASAYKEVTEFPLEKAGSLGEILDYPKWPSPDWFDYGCVHEQVAEARAAGKVVMFMGDRLNRCAQLKPAMYLRGVGQILLDLALQPEIAEALFGRIAAFYLEYARRTLEAADGGIDIFFTGDDFGTQDATMVSPQMWRQFLRPGFEAFIALGHRYGCKVAHHTCGCIAPLLGDFVECGLDILNPLQPDVAGMDYREIKARFGDAICFHGAISIQRTLPFGSPDDVRAEVRDRVEALAPNGGFLFCTAHNIQADTPLANIEALFEAYHSLGRY